MSEQSGTSHTRREAFSFSVFSKVSLFPSAAGLSQKSGALPGCAAVFYIYPKKSRTAAALIKKPVTSAVSALGTVCRVRWMETAP